MINCNDAVTFNKHSYNQVAVCVDYNTAANKALWFLVGAFSNDPEAF